MHSKKPLLLPCCLLQLCQAASEAASQLSRLWKQSAHTKLLQQPPTQKMSAKHAALFLQSKKHTAALEHALSLAAQICADLQQQGHPQHGQDFVDRVLASKPVPTLTRLLMWLQQKPERLQLHALEAWSTSPASSSSSNHLDYGILWMVTAGGKRIQLEQSMPALEPGANSINVSTGRLCEEHIHSSIAGHLLRLQCSTQLGTAVPM